MSELREKITKKQPSNRVCEVQPRITRPYRKKKQLRTGLRNKIMDQLDSLRLNSPAWSPFGWACWNALKDDVTDEILTTIQEELERVEGVVLDDESPYKNEYVYGYLEGAEAQRRKYEKHFKEE